MRFILVVLAVVAATVAVADGIRIRAEFAPGQQFHYTWELEGTNTWTPPISGTMSGTMRTDFDFDLVAERVVDGEATFLVKGRSLESIAKGPKGALGINASPEQAKLLLGKTWTKPGPKTPLKNRITLTLGPRFNVTGSSGLQHIALYFLPGVDHRVWFALMTAPKTPLEPGKGWTQKFRVPIKELGDRPLDVDLHFRVDESTAEDGRRVVVVRLSGKLGLTDFNVDLKKGRTLHVTSGTYSVTGRTEWDAARGIPLTIEAEQWIDAVADNPVTTFEHHARSHLALVEAGR